MTALDEARCWKAAEEAPTESTGEMLAYLIAEPDYDSPVNPGGTPRNHTQPDPVTVPAPTRRINPLVTAAICLPPCAAVWALIVGWLL